MPRPRHCDQRATSAPDTQGLTGLLPKRPHPPVLGQGRSRSATHGTSGTREDRQATASRRATSAMYAPRCLNVTFRLRLNSPNHRGFTTHHACGLLCRLCCDGYAAGLGLEPCRCPDPDTSEVGPEQRIPPIATSRPDRVYGRDSPARQNESGNRIGMRAIPRLGRPGFRSTRPSDAMLT